MAIFRQQSTTTRFVRVRCPPVITDSVKFL